MNNETAARLRAITEVLNAFGFWGGLGLAMVVGCLLLTLGLADYEIEALFGMHAKPLEMALVACLSFGAIGMVSCPAAPGTAAYQSQWLRSMLGGSVGLLMLLSAAGAAEWLIDATGAPTPAEGGLVQAIEGLSEMQSMLMVRIPTEASRAFRRKPAGDSNASQPSIPRQTSHP